MYIAQKAIRVRYGETDQMGYVYHGNYPLYYEEARTEMFRLLGLSYRRIEEDGIMMPVRSLSIRYIAPARYDDLIVAKAIVKEMPDTKIRIFHEIDSLQCELINTGEVELVFVDARTRKPCKAPEILTKALDVYLSR